MSPKSSPVLVVDVETSGVNPFRHKAMAVAFVPYEGEAPFLELYISQPEVEWSEYARSNFRRYEDKWQAHAITPAVACNAIESYVDFYFAGQQITLLGHNIGFDVAFLRQIAFAAGRSELPKVSHRAIDTHTMLYLLAQQGAIPNSALTSEGALQHFNIAIPDGARHTALGDALATRSLAQKLFQLFSLTCRDLRASNIGA